MAIQFRKTELRPSVKVRAWNALRQGLSDRNSNGREETRSSIGLEMVPAELRSRLHSAQPVVFPGPTGPEVAQGAWEFGLLNELPRAEADHFFEVIAEQAFQTLRPFVPPEDLVIVCFSAPIHRCGMALAAKIAKKYGSIPHVVRADGYSQPTLWCSTEELKDKLVIVFVDVVRLGGLVERLCGVCREASPRDLFALAVIDEAETSGMTPRLALWRDVRKPRIRQDEFDDCETDLMHFDPETGRATELLQEVVDPQTAQSAMETSLEQMRPVWPWIQETRAFRADAKINGVHYPWAIDDLALLRHPEAGSEIVRRAAEALESLNDGSPWCLVYPAERHQRAGAWARALHAQLGWPIVPIGVKDRKHFRGLTARQHGDLSRHGRAIVVDAVLRTGKTLRSLIHLLTNGQAAPVKRVEAFYVFDGSYSETRDGLERDLGLVIRSLFRVPLPPPIEPVWRLWRARLTNTLAYLEREKKDAFSVVRAYCERKLKPSKGYPAEQYRPQPEIGLRLAIEEAHADSAERLKHACERPAVKAIKHLDANSALRNPKVRNRLHGFVCNSMPPPFVEACALALASVDDYSWFDCHWLVLHRAWLAAPHSERWQFLACIAYWIKEKGDPVEIERLVNALEQFRNFREPDVLLPDQVLESRCNDIVNCAVV